MADSTAKPTVQMITLGCAKNEVDSEEMLGVLERDGYDVRSVNGHADVVIINTCGFIEAAKEESIEAILRAVERKKRGGVGKVVVTGCLSQRHAAELAHELPEVDVFMGAGQMGAIGGVVRDSLLRPEQILRMPERPHHRWVDVPTRIRTSAPWTAYLKISEGCNHTCSFCAIPSFRGRHTSKPMERALEEATLLACEGVRELNLIAQDSTQYGYDITGRPMLPELLRELSGVDGIRWIRLFYCYPSRVNAAVIEAIANTPKVCQYIDIPLQHADDQVLRGMRRPMTGAAYLRLVQRFRVASPDVCLRTTFIVGFPGETEEQFANLLRFVEKAQFDRVGVFEYSAEAGTPAASMSNLVPARMKRSRKDRLMRLQQQISLDRNRRWIGRDMEVLVEGPAATAAPSSDRPVTVSWASHAVGRSFRDAPEIDGRVFVSGSGVSPGTFVTVRITDAGHYDLTGSEK